MSQGSLVRLPPPAGAEWLACSDAEIDVGLAARWVVEPSCGAVVTFTGTVRDHSEVAEDVRFLEYEAYEEHVVPTLATVAADLRQRFPDLGRIVIWHRTGSLAVTDTAVVVAVAAPHRGNAFEAARLAIDTVKATAPIWKREHHAGGAEWVRCNHVEPGQVTA
jgi:molybdopterin synthase catalytic subunit